MDFQLHLNVDSFCGVINFDINKREGSGVFGSKLHHIIQYENITKETLSYREPVFN